ncbi:MAG: UDP-N-acetylglucosamine 2-epimerase, partial [Planctomycetota bacterium]
PEALAGILEALALIGKEMRVVWPIHPRSRARLREFGLGEKAGRCEGLIACDPLGYLDFLALMSEARVVLTDSGGIQEETCVLGVPCVTLRANTERPSTVEAGANVLVGNDTGAIVEAALRARRGSWELPPLWDGKAADRIVRAIEERFGLAR